MLKSRPGKAASRVVSIVVILAAAVLFSGISDFVYAENEGLQKELQDLKAQIRMLQERIKTLEDQNLPEKVKQIEIAQKEPAQGVISAERDLINIGGEAKVKMISTQKDHSDIPILRPDNDNTRFSLGDFKLEFEVKPHEAFHLDAEVKFTSDNKVKLSESYLTFSGVTALDQEFFVGLKDRFVDFEDYGGDPMTKTAFFDDPDLGIQYSGKYKKLYWRFSLTNGTKLKDGGISEDDGARDNIVVDSKALDEEHNNNKQIGVGLGYIIDLPGKMGLIDIMGFGYFSKLVAGAEDDEYDLAFLKNTDNFPNAPQDTSDKKSLRTGFNLSYIRDALEIYIQDIYASDSFLRRNAFTIQSSYMFDLKYPFLEAIQPVFRFDQYTVKWPHMVNYPLTWNRTRYTFALLNHIKKDKLTLELVYNLNKSRTGGAKPRNNEFFAELKYAF